MTWKEKIRFCIDVLFKGRDIKEELNAVERERIEVGERMREQLEFIINFPYKKPHAANEHQR